MANIDYMSLTPAEYKLLDAVIRTIKQATLAGSGAVQCSKLEEAQDMLIRITRRQHWSNS